MTQKRITTRASRVTVMHSILAGVWCAYHGETCDYIYRGTGRRSTVADAYDMSGTVY